MGALRVVTVRELVISSGSLKSHSKSVRRHRHLVVVMRAKGDTQSPLLKAKTKYLQACLTHNEGQTQAAGVKEAHVTSAL